MEINHINTLLMNATEADLHNPAIAYHIRNIAELRKLILDRRTAYKEHIAKCTYEVPQLNNSIDITEAILSSLEVLELPYDREKIYDAIRFHLERINDDENDLYNTLTKIKHNFTKLDKVKLYIAEISYMVGAIIVTIALIALFSGMWYTIASSRIQSGFFQATIGVSLISVFVLYIICMFQVEPEECVDYITINGEYNHFRRFGYSYFNASLMCILFVPFVFIILCIALTIIGVIFKGGYMIINA